jgi:hypothetical protein
VLAKLGEVCELDPGHVSNKIGQKKTMSAKLHKIFWAKFREINFNFVIISYFVKIKIDFRIHPTSTQGHQVSPKYQEPSLVY